MTQKLSTALMLMLALALGCQMKPRPDTAARTQQAQPPTLAIAATPSGANAATTSPQPSDAGARAETGFPADFPRLLDQGGRGAGTLLTGFGGDPRLNRAGNRAAVTKPPVILLHGNSASATSKRWGMGPLQAFLKEAGYNDSEIWAVSYLGQNNIWPDIDDPHRNNIADVRSFVDAVTQYLGVSKVVLIGHSLGAGMARGYLLGLDRDGQFKPGLARFDRVAGLITLAGGNYGLGYDPEPLLPREFRTGGAFEVSTHKIPGAEVWDDTPYGAKTAPPGNRMAAIPLPDNRPYNGGKFGGSGAALDVGDDSPRRIYYAGLVATGDFVDSKMKNSGYLQGADVNAGWVLGSSFLKMKLHERIIKEKKVFTEGILPVLEKINAVATKTGIRDKAEGASAP